MHKRVLVVGGGIAGIQASLDLAEMNIEVYLIEKGPSIGGRMTQLDKTFPTNDCAMCILSPKLVEAGSHPYIKIITNAELESITGEAPNFEATILKKPRYVNEEKCTGCGICMTKCPVKIPDEYNKGLSKTKCIHIPFPQAVPAIPIIDKENCLYHQKGKCRNCEKFCEMKAIDFNQKEETIKINVGSVILALGSEEFDATLKDEYGYKTFPNVMTSIEFERILSASGPTLGHILRPSDGKEPKRIAFIQCVGSRDMQLGNEYCSAVCCMQATKDAILVQEHLSGAETSIFYMDMRAYGKDFDKFVDRAKNDYSARFIHARISSIEVNPDTEDLIIQYATDEGKIKREEFELVVLSVGLISTGKIKETAGKLNIELNECGFSKASSFTPVSTSRVGIFVAGTFSGPKDIPETVMEASGSVSSASSLLVDFPVKIIKEELPEEINIEGQPPRVGVFVCRCGINIAATVDVPEVVKYASALGGVVYSQEFMFACSQDSQKSINEKIKEKNLNRVVVAACTPRTHEPLFQKTLQASGLNPYLFEFANIREHCSWVHQKEKDLATQKACDLIRMAVSKVRLLNSLSKSTLAINKKALVIGGGVAGMVASLGLASQGFGVHLVEKEADLGGNFRHIHYTLNGEETQNFLASLIQEVKSNKMINLYTKSEIKEITGYVGNFRTLMDTEDGKKKEIEHGVVIVATGAGEYKPTEYLYGQEDRVITQRQLEEWLAANVERLEVSAEHRAPATDLIASNKVKRQPEIHSQLQGTNSQITTSNPRVLNTVVMIQCVGSRDEERPYCSRVCCTQAIKNALKLRELNPKLNIYIIYRDIRSYGIKELYYKKAREEGVIFIRYEEESKPEVRNDDGKLNIKVKDLILNRDLIIGTDLLVLSSGIVANKGNKDLSQMLKVPLNADGFFLEAHVKLRPVDFATDGIFVCGLAHYPKDISEAITQAKASVARAMTILTKEYLQAEGKVSEIRKDRCSGCGLCVAICPYKALELDEKEKVAVVNEALCKGCGACVSSCRANAIDLKGFKDEQILAALEVV
ncbi:MAG: heterodisulfide reductase [Candidatus Schekmanbacteria bacterium RBG_16_38_10]|uniref:Heterodisulfide reductase n=1 Tax=Candidatus Schekmanbacteria bacterium RBG_16_38_10 TaxID=1817879 RepID=A0A1F7RZT8_9BACT|nr:MAG: heterodisulfide reductase [Candidatus Schekmanbacteria bacterium RBG_16_38_10]